MQTTTILFQKILPTEDTYHKSQCLFSRSEEWDILSEQQYGISLKYRIWDKGLSRSRTKKQSKQAVPSSLPNYVKHHLAGTAGYV